MFGIKISVSILMIDGEKGSKEGRKEERMIDCQGKDVPDFYISEVKKSPFQIQVPQSLDHRFFSEKSYVLVTIPILITDFSEDSTFRTSGQS